MKRNYKINQSIYIEDDSGEYDLHNDYDFKGLHYSIEGRILVLKWSRTGGEWVNQDMPMALSIKFSGVSEFRFMPRDKDIPFTEDDCLNSFGYWVDEDWAEGVITINDNQAPEPEWLTGIDFMSGAVIAIQAEQANLEIKA